MMISRIAPTMVLLLATLGTTPLLAGSIDRVAPPDVASTNVEPGPRVNVMNNHGRQVAVYAVDRDNRRHLLGTVGAFRSKELQIPAELTAGAGTVQLKVYPILEDPGLGVTAYEPDGIKTRGLAVGPDQLVVLYLDPDLTRSRIAIATG